MKAIAQKYESFFIIRVIRIVDKAGVLVQKRSLGFLERDAVLCKVQSGLAAIPGKFYIAHSIILAIWRCCLASICAYSRPVSRGGRKRSSGKLPDEAPYCGDSEVHGTDDIRNSTMGVTSSFKQERVSNEQNGCKN
jgi:hypothetical protein